ncbi:MAG: polysaccharide deacetylase family protein [Kineosporiaceae bacterium]
MKLDPGTAGASLCTVDAPGTVVMTYDDGPHPEGTPAVLDALAEASVSATFFVLLSRARRRPDLLARIVDAGHEIALHGLDHTRLDSYAPSVALDRQVRGREELEQLAGAPVRWYRPPYGGQSVASWSATLEAGLTPVVWSVVLEDWVTAPLDVLVGRGVGAVAGDVVLAHDGFADAIDGSPDLDAVEPEIDKGELSRGILAGLRSRGLRPVSLGDAVALGAPVLRPWLSPAAGG